MKLSLLTLAFAVLAFLPQSFAMDKDHMATPTVKAVAFHSDNCRSCKILGPKMKEAMNAINQDKIEVIKLDFTDESTKLKSQELAATKGVSSIMETLGPKTGFVVILDSKGNEVDKLKVDDDTPEIAAKLAKAIASAS